MGFWEKISNIGLKETDNEDDVRHIRLVNQMCFLGTFTTFFFVPYLYAVGNTHLTIVQSLTGLFTCISFLLNANRLFNVALYSMLSFLTANIIYCSLEFPGSGVEFFLIPLCLIPFIVIRNTLLCVGFSSSAAAAFSISCFLKKGHVPHTPVAPELTELTFYIVIATVFFLCPLIIYQLRTANANFEDVIKLQKQTVEDKNKDITDSIHYAKRIQQAMLTSTEYFTQHLKNSYFIFYQPKDIVSGDFYWAAEHNDVFYMATADCTGHGVPGAFMSLLNISFLNESVMEKDLKDPSKILDEQRHKIIKALNPTGTENSKDGMDCVLCAFNFKQNKIQFAAANNPLWMIRDEALTEFNPDKMPVGKHEDQKPFAQHEIELKTGDIIYTFTDGFADQFGGPKGKKFMYKRFSNLLLQIHKEPMEKQKEILAKTITDWRGKLEQVDDVLVIGVKI